MECLGKGSSGTVYKALDTFSGDEVALKVLDASLFQGGGINEMSRQQFMNEASLAGRLQHPHIASILEACIDEQSGYIAVEYVAGGDLSKAVTPGGLLKVEEVFEIAFKCCGARPSSRPGSITPGSAACTRSARPTARCTSPCAMSRAGRPRT